jgi:hypothetical protein
VNWPIERCSAKPVLLSGCLQLYGSQEAGLVTDGLPAAVFAAPRRRSFSLQSQTIEALTAQIELAYAGVGEKGFAGAGEAVPAEFEHKGAVADREGFHHMLLGQQKRQPVLLEQPIGELPSRARYALYEVRLAYHA